MKTKLNMGCYKDIKKDYVNLDKYPWDGVDVVHDLEKLPYPFKDNSFAEIYMRCILEHINSNNTQNVLEEVWRITKPNGKVTIIVPFEERWMDFADHTRGFNFHFFNNNLCSKDREWMSKASFRLLSLTHTPSYVGRIIFFEKLRQKLSNHIKGLVQEVHAVVEVVK